MKSVIVQNGTCYILLFSIVKASVQSSIIKSIMICWNEEAVRSYYGRRMILCRIIKSCAAWVRRRRGEGTDIKGQYGLVGEANRDLQMADLEGVPVGQPDSATGQWDEEAQLLVAPVADVSGLLHLIVFISCHFLSQGLFELCKKLADESPLSTPIRALRFFIMSLSTEHLIFSAM